MYEIGEWKVGVLNEYHASAPQGCAGHARGDALQQPPGPLISNELACDG